MECPTLAFFRGRTIGRFLLAYVGMTCLSPWVAAPGSGASNSEQSSDCSDSIRSCKRPVKFISKYNGCYTFACEYGLSTQHNIHTNSQADVKVLLQMQ